jgi:hypothetical protein
MADKKLICKPTFRTKKMEKAAANSTGSASDAIDKGTKRAKNWGDQERSTLAKLVIDNHSILFGELGPELTASMQKKCWIDIARQLTK